LGTFLGPFWSWHRSWASLWETRACPTRDNTADGQHVTQSNTLLFQHVQCAKIQDTHMTRQQVPGEGRQTVMVGLRDSDKDEGSNWGED